MLHLKVKRDLKELAATGRVNDFIVLENYLDQCVKLRLSEGEGKAENLKEAHDISTIITRIFGILNQKFEGKIPVFELIEARKIVAKFIGLAFFKLGRECLMKLGPNCAINGPCCPLHRLEGLKEAHELFPKLFEPFGINLEKIDATTDTFFTSLLAVLIDFKTQIIVSDLALMSEKTSEGLSIHLENLLETYYGNSMEIPYLKGKLQQRAVQIRSLLTEQEGKLADVLNAKYPVDLFESNLKNVLKSVYAAFPETILNEFVKKQVEEPAKKTTVATLKCDGEPVMKHEGESVMKHESESVMKREADTALRREADTTLKLESEPTCKPVTETAKVNHISETTEAKTVTESVKEYPFKNVIISGKFFRGILEPVDERFAAIIEGRDVNVKQYLMLRKKKAASGEKFVINQAKKAKVNNSASKENDAGVNRSSLMERHDSAERISWETQQRDEPESSSKEDEIIRISRPEPSHRPPAKITQTMRPPGSRGRRKFSEQEVLNLIEGIRRFGRDWRRILDTYEFDERSNVDLKDKARNLERLGLL